MRMKNRKRFLAAALAAVMVFNISPGRAGFDLFPAVAYGYTERQATVKATSLNIRSGPGTSYASVAKLGYGTAVTVVGEASDSAGTKWYQLRFSSGQNTGTGYASSAYIKFPVAYTTDADFENYLNQQGFPEGYKDSLRLLHAEYPSWVFQAQHTGLDWNDVISNEGKVGANLVDKNSISSWKSTEYGAYDWNTGKWPGFDGATWVAASKEIVCYYMDPRNFLNETYIFQFLLHSYDTSIHTREGLQSLVKGTFMENSANVGGGSEGSNGASGSQSGGSGGAGNTGGPGNTGGAGNTGGPGSAQNGASSPEGGQSGGSGYGPGYNGAGSQSSGSAAPGGTQQSQPAGTTGEGGSGNVSFEGPSLSVRENDTYIAAATNVEYGPGMDASVITGDETGASETSPVPSGASYVDIIMNAAQQSNVNPYVIGAMIIQEQGKGTSGSISGKTPGYEGYYNFFNIGAYEDSSMSAVTRGLWYASQAGSYGRPWNSIEKSIVGGAMYYGDNYVKAGQDTFYLKKFNVQGSNLYKHQYMTNVEGAAGEGAKLSNAYTADMKKQTLVFKIPVYKNMPQTACARPAVSGSPNNKLASLSVEGYALTPTFSMDTESYDIIVNPAVSSIAVSAPAIDSKAVVSITGADSLQSGTNVVKVEVKAENGSVRTYRLNVVRRSDAPVVNAPNAAGPAGGTAAGGSSPDGPGMTGGPGSPEGSGQASAETAPPSPGEGSQPGAAQGGQENVQVGIAPDGSGAGTAGQPAGSAPAAESPTSAPTKTEPAETESPSTAAPETEPPSKAPSSTGGSPGSGDVNGDGNVSVLDLMMIKKHILGETILSGEGAAAADVNGDGKISKADADALEKKILGK